LQQKKINLKDESKIIKQAVDKPKKTLLHFIAAHSASYSFNNGPRNLLNNSDLYGTQQSMQS
jgi:hypothetical protein